MTTELNLAEIPFEDGTIHYRYARYMSADGTRWIRHGLFCCYYRDGSLASEGNYIDGAEDGLWTDYHENGQMAARGRYKNGEKVGRWDFWDNNGIQSTE